MDQTADNMRKLIVLLMAGTFQFVQAQNIPVNKLTLSTHHLVAEMSADATIPVLIKGNVPQAEKIIRDNGGYVKFTTGNIISAELPRNTILALNNSPFIEKIDCPVGKIVPMNDMMVLNNNVDSAYYGYAPLLQGFDGSGIVVGVIDAPFDIYHGDFKNAAGEDKIKSIWDQNLAGGPHPDPFGYGKECDSATIADGDCSINDNNELNYSHGSGVAGVAASSGLAANKFRGVAPNADLILVSFDFTADFTSRVADAVNYIYTKADAMGKPCVINTSIGTYDGSHDGKDLLSETISSMVTEHAGRSLVAAAGNAGNQLIHLSYDISADAHFTWLQKLSYTDAVYFQLFADSSEFNHANFSIGADDPAGYIYFGSSPEFNMLSDFDLNDGDIDSALIDIPGAGTGWLYVQLSDGVYMIEVDMDPLNATTLWRFTTSGSGTFDMWSGETTTGYSNFVTTGLPDAVTMPDIINYKLPDWHQTIVSSWQCSDDIITVGSYVNRDTMTNYYNEYPPLIDTLGELFYSSSRGPTRDDRIKPDICASGARILSTEASVLSDWLISLGSANYMSPDGMHYLYNGTSFASPIVAGIAALYLQEFPNAWNDDIKQAILSTANRDAFTGDALPDNDWGYGKANAFRALLVSYVSADQLAAPDAITVFPNPVGGLIHITGLTEPATMELKNMLGETIITQLFNTGNNTLDLSEIADGMYLISLQSRGNIITKRIIVSGN